MKHQENFQLLNRWYCFHEKDRTNCAIKAIATELIESTLRPKAFIKYQITVFHNSKVSLHRQSTLAYTKVYIF